MSKLNQILKSGRLFTGIAALALSTACATAHHTPLDAEEDTPRAHRVSIYMFDEGSEIKKDYATNDCTTREVDGRVQDPTTKAEANAKLIELNCSYVSGVGARSTPQAQYTERRLAGTNLVVFKRYRVGDETFTFNYDPKSKKLRLQE